MSRLLSVFWVISMLQTYVNAKRGNHVCVCISVVKGAVLHRHPQLGDNPWFMLLLAVLCFATFCQMTDIQSSFLNSIVSPSSSRIGRRYCLQSAPPARWASSKTSNIRPAHFWFL